MSTVIFKFGECIGILTLGGPTYKIVVGIKTWYFEMHPRLGPCPTRKDGEEAITPRPKKFWTAIQEWIRQGKQLDGDLCVWTPREFYAPKDAGKWVEVMDGDAHAVLNTKGKILRYHSPGYGPTECELCGEDES